MTNFNLSIEKSFFDQTPEGQEIFLFTLKNSNGLEARILNFGGIIQSLWVPNLQGTRNDIVLGFSDIKTYLKENIYAALIGRIAGRLTKGQFKIGETTYQVTQNVGDIHIHGGEVGFDKRVWDAKIIQKSTQEVLQLHYLSPDGEEGYPGNLDVKVDYYLSSENGLRLDLTATTDKTTPICLTHHAYFNLGGEGQKNIFDHELQIPSAEVVLLDDKLYHTGKIQSVEGRAADFRQAIKIGERLPNLFKQHGDIYINNNQGAFQMVAQVAHPSSKITMEAWTTQPYLQFYTGQHLNVESGKSKQPYLSFAGFCLECQGYPDAPNHKGFESIYLLPNEVYRQSIEFRFTHLE